MARPELIYDSAAAAQVISKGEIINVSKRGELLRRKKKLENGVGEERDDFGHMPGFIKFKKGKLKGVIGAKISEKEMGNEESQMRCTVKNLILLKRATRKTKGGWAYEIRPPKCGL